VSDGDRIPVVAIVGAGFGGLRAARALQNAPVRIVMVDRNNYHLFQPLLYQAATGGVLPNEIAYPARTIFRQQPNFQFRMAAAHRVDIDARRLHLDNGVLDYDYLILAPGGQTNFFGLEGVAQNAFQLKGLEDAVEIRNHILHQFELAAHAADRHEFERRLTFVIVGGGPTGVEFAGALSELVRLVLVKDFPWLQATDVCIYLLEALDRLLPALPESLQREAGRMLARKHVHVRLEASVEDYDGRTLTLEGGETIDTYTMVWAAGVRAAELTAGLGVEQDKLGRVTITPTLQLPGHPEVFVIGDAAHLEVDGEPLPMVAPVAIQQGQAAAENIQRAIRGEALQPFDYRDRGTLATIGRNDGVAAIWGRTFSGFVAWILWLAVHIIQLIGFRNRLGVLINWAWDYFFYERAARNITRA
jgi:NADH:ubiquinone reductase (H+-translocating)